jgi:hypothetical protein
MSDKFVIVTTHHHHKMLQNLLNIKVVSVSVDWLLYWHLTGARVARAVKVRSPAEARGFFPLGSVFRPALWPTQPPVQWVPGFLSPGVKRGRGVTLITYSHLVSWSWMSRSYTSTSPKRCHRCVVGELYIFFFLLKFKIFILDAATGLEAMAFQ